MGDRGRQLAHRRDAVGMRELQLRLTVPPLVFARFRLHPLADSQIKYVGNALVPAIFNVAPPISTGTRLPSLLAYSFSNGSNRPPLRCCSILALFLSRQSGGVRSAHLMRPETSSSRS